MPMDVADLGARIGVKRGGIHKGDTFCGVYKKEDTVYLVKRDLDKPANDIAEYLSSKLFEHTAPGTGAELNLVRTEQHTYLVSTFFKNYQDLYQSAGFDERPIKKELFESLFSSRQYIKDELLRFDYNDEYLYQDYERCVVSSLLIGDFSLHSGNIGVVSRDELKKLVRVDFGAAMRGLTCEINSFQSIENRMGLEKNYLKRDHPPERMFSRDFCAELRRVAEIDLISIIIQQWKLIKQFYNLNQLQQFVTRLGTEAELLPCDDIDMFLCTKIGQRQMALKQMAWDIELALEIEFIDGDSLAHFLLNCPHQQLMRAQMLVIDPQCSSIAPFYEAEYTSQMLQQIVKELVEQRICVPQQSFCFFEQKRKKNNSEEAHYALSIEQSMSP